MSWKEETDLKKALYASLQKQRSSKVESGTREVAGDERPEKFSSVNEVLQSQTLDSKLKSEQQGTVKSICLLYRLFLSVIGTVVIQLVIMFSLALSYNISLSSVQE